MPSDIQYASISLPLKFVMKFIDPFVTNSEDGYSSRAEVIKDAIRLFQTKTPRIENQINEQDEEEGVSP